jgi:hypothetical protein
MAFRAKVYPEETVNSVGRRPNPKILEEKKRSRI